MYKHIMLPVDGSKLSVKAVKECIAFAKSIGAKVTAIHVVSHFSLGMTRIDFASEIAQKLEKDHEEESKKHAEEMLAKIEKLTKADGVECDSVVVVGDHPYEEIIENAAKRNCDLIMMASHGRRGLEGLLLGSETVKVLTHSKIPVLVVR